MQRARMELIFLAYGLSKEIINAIMMLYKNMKVMVHPLDHDTGFFDTVTAV